jgi:hypothetical protein
MRSNKSWLILSLAALMVMIWSGIATGVDGDPIRAGQNTTATAQTSLTPTLSSGNGFRINQGGTSQGAALNAINNGPGTGVSG